MGALGGWLYGFLILSFGFFIGKSGDSGPGQESFGYWKPFEMFVLAGFYGMPLGIIIFPLSYFIFLQDVPIYRLLIFTSIGTLAGGLCGALIEPPVAALSGVIGFFIAAFMASRSN